MIYLCVYKNQPTALGVQETGFYSVDSFQGEREDGPADVERANADAQVTHFNARCDLLQVVCVKTREDLTVCLC